MEKQTITNTEENALILNELRSEVNLLVLPFFALNNREISKRAESTFQTEIIREGKKIEIAWYVSANTKFGYPGPLAKRIHKAIEEKLHEIDLPICNPIQFSTYEMCKRLGEGVGGRQYKRIKRALKSIKGASIESKGTFYHKGKKRYLEKIFSLYDKIVFMGEELEDGKIAETNYLYLNELYLDSINAKYVKPLDFGYYQGLTSNVARRLYELLGVKFYYIVENGHPWIRYRYSTLCQLLPLRRQKYLSKAKQIMNPAHEELRDTNFLKDFFWDEIENEKDWLIYYFPGNRAKKEIHEYTFPESRSYSSQSTIRAEESKAREAEVSSLKKEMVEVLEDESSKRFYGLVAKRCPPNLVFRTLSEVKDEERRGNIRKSKGALFTYKIQQLCKKKGIDLGLKSS